MSIFLSTIEAAEFWLGRGFALVPKQPDSKNNIAGFGGHARTLTTLAESAEWFGRRKCNLAVVIPAGVLCVDFDTPDIYGAWRAAEGVAFRGYIETTRRGYHVIGRGDAGRLVGVAGVEFKKAGAVVTVAPSRVGGVAYSALTDFEFGRLPITSLVDPSAPAGIFPTECFLALPAERTAQPAPAGADVVGVIKSRVDILAIAKTITTLRPGPNGAWVGNCPFHSDKERHFYVLPAAGLWGCHSGQCKAHGKAHDVINLVAEAEGITVKTAIAKLYREAVK